MSELSDVRLIKLFAFKASVAFWHVRLCCQDKLSLSFWVHTPNMDSLLTFMCLTVALSLYACVGLTLFLLSTREFIYPVWIKVCSQC